MTDGTIYRQKLTAKQTDESLPASRITSSRDAVELARLFWDADALTFTESAYALFLNASSVPVAWALLSVGGITGTVVDNRVLFAHGVLCGARGVIIFHNHPSGDPHPSDADIGLTKKVKTAGDALEIKLMDHIILTNGTRYYSFADEGHI